MEWNKDIVPHTKTSRANLAFGLFTNLNKSNNKPDMKPKIIRGNTETIGLTKYKSIAVFGIAIALIIEKIPKARPETKPSFQP